MMSRAEMFFFYLLQYLSYFIFIIYRIQVGMKFTSFILEVSFKRFFYGIVGVFHWSMLAIRKIIYVQIKKAGCRPA
jgi:hypothetical protein